MWDVQAAESDRSRKARSRARSSLWMGRKSRWYLPACLITDLVGAGVPVALVWLVLLFWVPELILSMGGSKFWIVFATQFFIWSLFAVSFNLLMGYTGMVSFGQAAYLGIGGYTAGLLLKNIAGLSFWVGLAAWPAIYQYYVYDFRDNEHVAHAIAARAGG